jgi:ABC-type phosphonate transport system ATPase subunit
VALTPRPLPRDRTRRAEAVLGFQGGQRVQNLVVFREAPGLVFAVDEPAIGLDVEDAASTLDELCVEAVFALDGGRQTGGPGVVVSLHAVRDADLHGGRCLSW